MMLKKLIAAVMAVTTMFSVMSVNAGAAQPEAHISSTGAVYYDEDTSTDVEIISSRIVIAEDKDYNEICLNVGAKVALSNIFKLADGYDFDDFSYTLTDTQGDKTNDVKIIKSSGKYYIKAVDEGILNYIRVFYKNKLIATTVVHVENSFKNASKISVSTKNPKIGQDITLKGITSSNKYADCTWIIVGDSSWGFPATWYVDWNINKSRIGKATLSFNDFGKVKIYCLSPNGKLKKVEINISEEMYDDSVNYPDKTWFYSKWTGVKAGYIKSDGSVVITNKEAWSDYGFMYEPDWDSFYYEYSWKEGVFYEIYNNGKDKDEIGYFVLKK